MKLQATCRHCGAVTECNVTEADWAQYIAGALVQNIWPEKSADEREVIMNCRVERKMDSANVCGDCWDIIFKEEDEL